MTAGTNVLVPVSALEALEAIRIERGYRSRNQTVRELLAEYVAEQQDRGLHERWMHISSLLRYPLPRQKGQTSDQDGVQLRVPVDSRTWATVRSLAFRLPGQAASRGHHDYQPRPGTDAVLTAIARVRPLTDPVLGGIHQLLTHRQALGLWRIVVDITRSRHEKEVIDIAELDAATRATALANRATPVTTPTHAERVASELEARVAWHGSHRFDITRAIIADHLDGDDTTQFLHELDVQDRDGPAAWLDVVDRFRSQYDDELAMDEFAQFRPMEGRGATAVWRAERVVAKADVVAWLRRTGQNSTPRTHRVKPPGWQLRLPATWIPAMLPRPPILSSAWAGHIRAGRALSWSTEHEHLVWPTRETADGAAEPVPGVEAVIRELAGQPATRIAEVLLQEMQKAPTDHSPVQVPAHVAHDLGLIGIGERDALVARARTNPVRFFDTESGLTTDEEPESGFRPLMDHDVVFAELHELHPGSLQRHDARIAYARGQRCFVRYLRGIGYPRYHTHWYNASLSPLWNWPVSSLAEAIVDNDLDPEVLTWLAIYILALQERTEFIDMNNRWTNAASYRTRHETFQPPHLGDNPPAPDNSWDHNGQDHPFRSA